MEWPPVQTKQDFVRRYALGEFGNHSPTWGSLAEFIAYKYPSTRVGLCHIRNRIAGGPTWYSVPGEEVEHHWKQLVLHGADANNLYISLMAPTEQTLFQGEVIQDVGGLDLTYTTVAKPMRDALHERSLRARGIIAVALLRYYLCPRSYEWLQVLLDRYSHHAVEFSTYSRNWGTLPHYNTVFWEVRLY